MNVEQQNNLLNNILQNSVELLECSKGEVVIVNSKPSLEFFFEPGICNVLKKEKVNIFIDVHELRVMGIKIPHLRFTSYFPYPMKRDGYNFDFLLKHLHDLNREIPFVEAGILPNNSGELVLSFRCNRLLIQDSSINPAEVLFFIKSLLVNYEFAVSEYESNLS